MADGAGVSIWQDCPENLVNVEPARAFFFLYTAPAQAWTRSGRWLPKSPASMAAAYSPFPNREQLTLLALRILYTCITPVAKLAFLGYNLQNFALISPVAPGAALCSVAGFAIM
jgi:hypothetical protein